MKKIIQPLWRLLISLKFAVVIMTGLTLAMIVATFIESAYDTPTAQYWVYRATWFYLLLGGLGVNILFVALSRLPWQPKHVPFLMAHAGILILLWGSWLTYRYGLDGQMVVTEGARERAVELQENYLRLVEGNQVKSVRVPWTPPHAEFKPISIPEAGLTVRRFITHAEAKIAFLPSEDPTEGFPAIRLKIAGGPSAPPFMRAGQEFWMWLGDQSWSQSQVGGAQVFFRPEGVPLSIPEGDGAVMGFQWDPARKVLAVQSRASGSKELRKTVLAEAQLRGSVIDPGWRFEMKVTVLDFIPKARSEVSYVPSPLEYGPQAPPSALLLEASGAAGRRSEIWLGLGERASLESGGKKFLLVYTPARVSLPFQIELQKFQIENYQGTANPMSFQSLVNVHDERLDSSVAPAEHLISMNEPLKYGGYTFYQASYVPGEPRPVTSIFSVNQDPGRWVKHIGSILICLGSVLLFVMKNRKKKVAAR